MEIDKHAKPVVIYRLFANNGPKVIYQYWKFYRIRLAFESVDVHHISICYFPRIDFPKIWIDDGNREPQKKLQCFIGHFDQWVCSQIPKWMSKNRFLPICIQCPNHISNLIVRFICFLFVHSFCRCFYLALRFLRLMPRCEFFDMCEKYIFLFRVTVYIRFHKRMCKVTILNCV